jgi:hypothetical protein
VVREVEAVCLNQFRQDFSLKLLGGRTRLPPAREALPFRWSIFNRRNVIEAIKILYVNLLYQVVEVVTLGHDVFLKTNQCLCVSTCGLVIKYKTTGMPNAPVVLPKIYLLLRIKKPQDKRTPVAFDPL